LTPSDLFRRKKYGRKKYGRKKNEKGVRRKKWGRE
jgi:hypothetical protein